MNENHAGWSAPEKETLAYLWALVPQVSAAEIGRQMNRSKNSVIGCSHRMMLPSRPSPIVARDPAARRKSRSRNPARQVVVLPALQDVIEEFEPVLLREPTGWNACHWPLWGNSRPTHRYCGAVPARGAPYCHQHCTTAYTGKPALSVQAVRIF